MEGAEKQGRRACLLFAFSVQDVGTRGGGKAQEHTDSGNSLFNRQGN